MAESVNQTSDDRDVAEFAALASVCTARDWQHGEPLPPIPNGGTSSIEV